MQLLKRIFQIQLLTFLFICNAYGQLNFTVTLPDMLIGETGTATFEVSGFTDILTSQFTINYDPDILEFTTVNYTNPLLGNTIAFSAPPTKPKGIIGFSWFHASSQGLTIDDDTIMFAIEFKAICGNGDSTEISFENEPVVIEFSNTSGILLQGDYSMTNGTAIIGEVSNFNCRRINDSLALVELFNFAGGDNWTYDETTYLNYTSSEFEEIPNAGNIWDFNTPIDTWHGVSCTDDRVRSLILNKNGLGGSLTDLNLLGLVDFYCLTNNIQGAIPNFTNLPNLEVFVCGINNLSGALPDFINLPNLSIFNCFQNNLSGGIPDFANFPNLKEFICADNELVGSIPDFSNLPNLEIFNCHKNELSEIIPDFTNLPNLMAFNCYENNLSGFIPDFVSLPNLQVFNCHENSISGSIPDFTNLPNLEFFDCGDNELEAIIPDFTNLPNLTSLYVNENGLRGEIPDLSMLNALTTFICNNNMLSGCYPDFVCDLDNFNAVQNEAMPWNGDHINFCNGNPQIGAPCGATATDFIITEDCNCAEPLIDAVTEIRPSIDVSVHPNPFHDKLTISFNRPINKTISLQIYNSLGQQVYNQNSSMLDSNNSFVIELELSPAVYFYTINVEGAHAASGKLVGEKY